MKKFVARVERVTNLDALPEIHYFGFEAMDDDPLEALDHADGISAGDASLEVTAIYELAWERTE